MQRRMEITHDRVDEVFRAVARLDSHAVYIGFPGETQSRSEGGINNPTLAYIHEHGAPGANIPARPFLEPGVENARDDILRAFEAAVRRALGGDRTALTNMLDLAGVIGVRAVQDKIMAGPFAPLQPRTIARKKSSRPLIDTGQLRQAVTYVVRAN